MLCRPFLIKQSTFCIDYEFIASPAYFRGVDTTSTVEGPGQEDRGLISEISLSVWSIASLAKLLEYEQIKENGIL